MDPGESRPVNIQTTTEIPLIVWRGVLATTRSIVHMSVSTGRQKFHTNLGIGSYSRRQRACSNRHEQANKAHATRNSIHSGTTLHTPSPFRGRLVHYQHRRPSTRQHHDIQLPRGSSIQLP